MVIDTGSRSVDAALFIDDVAPDKWVTVRIHPQDSRTVGLLVMASWYCYEDGGSYPTGTAPHEQSAGKVADFRLFINGSGPAATNREMFLGSDTTTYYTRKNHSVCYFQPDVGDGILDVSIKVKVAQAAVGTAEDDIPANKRGWKFVWVRARNFVAIPFYL